ARAECDVDIRVQIEQTLALSLGVAAADRDHLLRVVPLERGGPRQVRGELRVRLLPDRAGVEDEDVGLLLRGRLPQPELLEHALDPLAVVSVHLAAERRDVVPPHGPEWYPWSFRTQAPCGSSPSPPSPSRLFRGRPSPTWSSRAPSRAAVSGSRRSQGSIWGRSCTWPRRPSASRTLSMRQCSR